MKSNSLPCSVVLATYGSTADEQANRSLVELADKIAASGIFSVVTPAFFDDEVNAINVLQELPPGDVVVVPIMTSDDHDLNQVLPLKLGENGKLDSYRMFITPTVGLHPEIPSLVADRVGTLMNLLGMNSSETTIIVIGQGTPQSEKTTQLLAERTLELLPDDEIRIAFIDQEPTVSAVIAETTRPHMLVVPFLIPHCLSATVDVPEAFGLPTGPDIEFPLVDLVGNGLIVCDLPIGLYPEIAELCLELASDQLLTGKPIQWKSGSEGEGKFGMI